MPYWRSRKPPRLPEIGYPGHDEDSDGSNAVSEQSYALCSQAGKRLSRTLLKVGSIWLESTSSIVIAVISSSHVPYMYCEPCSTPR